MIRPRISNEQLRPAFGIITALPKEYAAVRVLLENSRDYTVEGQGIGKRYTLGEIPTTNGGIHNVVLVLVVL